MEYPLDTSLKRCPSCPEPEENHWHPATTEYFGAYKRSKDGLRNLCKECRSKRDKHNRQANHEVYLAHDRRYRESHPERMRESDRKYRQSEKGKRNNRERQQRYRQVETHRERYRQYSRRYYWTHHEQCLEYLTWYRETHRDFMRLLNRTYYWTHLEVMQAHSRAYLKARPEQRRGYESHRRARKRAVPGTYTAQQVQEQLRRQNYCCYYAACGFAKFRKLDGKYVYAIEHTFPITRESARNDISHLVLACPSCNSKKGKKYPWEWFEGGRLL